MLLFRDCMRLLLESEHDVDNTYVDRVQEAGRALSDCTEL